MKKVILAVLMVVTIFTILSAQTQKEQGVVASLTSEGDRNKFQHELAEAVYHNAQFRLIFFPETTREEIESFIHRARVGRGVTKMQNLSQISRQDSLIAYAVGIDLSDRDAIERIQATRQVINQLAEEKAKIEVDKMLDATWKVALNNFRRSEEGYDVLERAPWDFVIDLFNNAISQRDSVNKE